MFLRKGGTCMEQYCLNINMVLFYQRNLKIEMLKARMSYETYKSSGHTVEEGGSNKVEMQ